MNAFIWILSLVSKAAADFSSSPPQHHMSASAPQGLFDYLLMIGCIVTVIFVGIYTLQCFIKPHEENADHIKRRMLKDDF